MSVDTKNKRACAMSTHDMALLPSPDGTISQADRQQVIGVYSGFAVSSIWSYVTENNTATWSAS